MSFVPSFSDIESAVDIIKDVVIETPLVESAELNARMGGRILLKAENLQRTGSFKFRGAYYRLALMTAAERAAGVVACSSGNHAQGVAAAAAILGIPAVIVMPADAPRIKIDNTRAYGAEVVTFDRLTENREEIAGRIAAERGSLFVPPYDDPHVIVGQGTAGLELMRQAAAQNASPDSILVCCSGGGLAAGTALAAQGIDPDVSIYVAEPQGFDDTGRSLRAGERLRNPALGGSICDALMAPMPGAVTFPINRHVIAGGVAVSDDEVRTAMRYAFGTLKLVLEPGGAAAFAAVLAGRVETRDRTIGVVLSGGNVDPGLYAAILAGM
ncbi:threonine/serine dehydratase [Govanella unica]|uniref:Threonine/serine dehydratase n=1 Tax=Govanella unica TaxID=2975056 RepID=A0A9X3Z706_9PROT|nr:threonine/serine dehydratase [Govania unica]MDA5193474.1 threonine/serine dehydratase [Govania unica]